jgi:hypothetical protein
MAVIIDNRSDISGIGKVSGLGAGWDFDIGEKIKALYTKKKAAVVAPAQATPVNDGTAAPAAPVTPPYVPTLKDKAVALWAMPVTKGVVGVAGLVGAVLAYKKWKK